MGIGGRARLSGKHRRCYSEEEKGWCKIEEEYFHTLNELFSPQLNSERRVQPDLIQGRQKATYLFRKKHSPFPTHLKHFLLSKDMLRDSELQRITWGVAVPRGNLALPGKGHPDQSQSPRWPQRGFVPAAT